jgi:hypothetical protein
LEEPVTTISPRTSVFGSAGAWDWPKAVELSRRVRAKRRRPIIHVLLAKDVRLGNGPRRRSNSLYFRSKNRSVDEGRGFGGAVVGAGCTGAATGSPFGGPFTGVRFTEVTGLVEDVTVVIPAAGS